MYSFIIPLIQLSHSSFIDTVTFYLVKSTSYTTQLSSSHIILSRRLYLPACASACLGFFFYERVVGGIAYRIETGRRAAQRRVIPSRRDRGRHGSLRQDKMMLALMQCAFKRHLNNYTCLLYTSPSPRDRTRSRMPSSA